MELQVTITLSDRLFGLLEDKLPNLGRRVEKAITKELGSQVRRESSIEVGLTATSKKSPTEDIVAENSKPQTIAVKETVQPDNSALEEIPSDPKKMAEKIREIMHLTRQRFEGEDYKENTDSEAYKKYHKQLTSQFKQIAISLGYEKPSTIDTPEKVAAFRSECDALIIDEKGFIAPPPAPY